MKFIWVLAIVLLWVTFRWVAKQSLFAQNSRNPQESAVVFQDDFTSGTGNWHGGIWDEEGYRTFGSLKVVDQSLEAGNHAVSNPLSLKRDRGYLLTGQIKTNGQVTSYSCMYLAMYDGQGNFVMAKESNMVKLDQWERARVELKPQEMPENVASVRILLQAAAGAAGETGTAWFDEISLREWENAEPALFRPAGADENAYTGSLYIKGSSTQNPYVNLNSVLTDGDYESCWMPDENDQNPFLELSHGKKELPARLVIKFSNDSEQPRNLQIACWDDEKSEFIRTQEIKPGKNSRKGIAEYLLSGCFPATRKLKIYFPSPYHEIAELRYFIRPEIRENWQAYWIWAKDQSSTANYEEFVSRAFRRTFAVGALPAHAVIQGRGDDSLQLFLNGHAVRPGEELKDKIVSGENVLGAIVRNERYAAGLLAEFDLLNADGSEQKIISDPQWKTALLPVPANWNTVGFDDRGWANSVATARPPFGPWGEIPYVMNSRRMPLELLSAALPKTLEVERMTELRFHFTPPDKPEKIRPLTLQLSRNGEIFYEDTIAGKEFFRQKKDGSMELVYPLKLNRFFVPGNYDIELKVPFCEVICNGRPWKGVISLVNQHRPGFTAARIVNHNGVSALEIAGQVNRSIWYTVPYMAGRATQKLMNREFGKAACNIAQIFVTPRIITPDQFDFTGIDRAVSSTLTDNPAAFIILKVTVDQLYPGFAEQFPDELCTLDNLKKLPCPSHASEVWQKISGKMLENLMKHVHDSPYADRIIGYFVLAGEEGQWFHHWGDSNPETDGSLSDYSPAMLNYFRNFLRSRYHTDAALQKAWHNPDVTFENAKIPSRGQRIRPHHNGMFRTAADQAAIDYGESLSDCVNRALGFYAGIIKKATANRALVFAYYGHLMDVGDGYLAELGGYLKQQDLLNNPDIDGFAGPLSYRPEFRDIGGTSSIDFPPSGSLRLHGKIAIQEDDLRTHLFPREYAYTIRLPWQSIAVLSREFSKTICDGAGMYLHEFGTDTRNWFDDPEYLDAIDKLNKLAAYIVRNRDLTPVSEIAVITSDHTLNHLNQKQRYIQRNVPETRAIYMRESIARIGAPFTEYLVSSFLNGKMPDHKFYIFLNTYVLTGAERDAILRKLEKNGASALFLYAPGLVGDSSEPDLRNMCELLGMNLKTVYNWKGPLQINFKLIGKGNPLQDRSGMSAGDTLDCFYAVDDPQAEALGTLDNSGEVVFARKKRGNTAVYFASFPFFSPKVLRSLARDAGVHIYMTSSDAFYRTGELFAVHTGKSPGPRRIELPGAMFVRQLYPERKDYGKIKELEFNSPVPETRIFECVAPPAE